MTADELKEYYDKLGQNKLSNLDAAGQQNMFDQFLKEENEKRAKQMRANRMMQARSSVKNVGLRNRSIKPRAFGKKEDPRNSSRNMSMRKKSMDMNNSIMIQRVSNNDAGDDALADVSMADVSMMSLNDDSQMMGVNLANMSMASDMSGGGVQKMALNTSDGSMMSGNGNDVQVKRAGNDVSKDMNDSMAGLSDYSMGDI